MDRKVLVIGGGVVLILLSIGVYNFVLKDRGASYSFATVRRGDIFEEVHATGEVVPDRRVDLQFEVEGRVGRVNKKKGEEVDEGGLIIELIKDDYRVEVSESKAAYDKARSEMDDLLAGASEQEIEVYQQAVEVAKAGLRKDQASLQKRKEELEEAEEEAEDDLRACLEDSLNVMEEAVVKGENALSDLSSIKRSYFTTNDQSGLTVKQAEDRIEREVERMEQAVDQAEIESPETIDQALAETRSALKIIFEEVKTVREECDNPSYRGQVSSADKTTLDNHKTHINTAHTDVVDAQQEISSTRIDNRSNVNSAQRAVVEAEASVDSSQAEVDRAQAELEEIQAPPREQAVEAARADLNRARAVWQTAINNLSKTELRSPCEGTVSGIEKEEGESVSVSQKVASVICDGELQIEVDIPETEIGKIKVGNEVRTEVDAFPGKEYEGRVVEVEPAETIIQGVVYYKTKVSFQAEEENVKPGMTAEVEIVTDSKQDVLIIPQRAVREKEGYKFVRVLDGKEIKERRVETGLRDPETNVEVVSGVSEGEKVVTFVKE